MITDIIQHYHPEWEPPPDNGRDWVPCLCPFHPDTMRSASLSYKRGAFKCHGCEVKGDAIAIIRQQGETSFEEAIRISESISPGGGSELPQVTRRKHGRRVFGDQGDIPDQRTGEKVPSRIRGRATPWQ